MEKQKIPGLFKTIRMSFHKNFFPIFWFTILYNLCIGIIVTPIITGLFYICMKNKNMYYLGTDNLKSFILSPLTWLCVILGAALMVYLMMVQVGGLSFAFNQSLNGIKTKLNLIIRYGLRTGYRSLKPKNLTCVPFILILMPFIGVINISNLSYEIGIPGFIMDFITANKILLPLFCLVTLVLLIITLFWVLSPVIFAVEENSFAKACKKSRKLTKKHRIRAYWEIFLSSTIFTLISTILMFLSVIVTCFIAAIATDSSEYVDLKTSGFVVGSLVVLICLTFQSVASMACLYSIYYRLSLRTGTDIPVISVQGLKRKHVTIIVALAIASFVISLFTSQFDVASFAEVAKRPEIAAHRGESVAAPENSLPAFKLAASEDFVDWIELDVHETKDEVIIVSHDDDLKRICGKTVYVHDSTYEELQQLDVGSWFSPDYAGLKLATLDEVLKEVKGKLKVQIEIKPTKYDKNIEEHVLDIIKANDMEDDCVILSLSSEPLIRIKEISPETTTMFCMAVGIGYIEDIPFADYLSIEESNVSAAMVERAHTLGKKCFVWTINSSSSVQKLVDMDVDVILTDDPGMIRDALDKAEYDSGIVRELRNLLPH